MSKSQLQHCRYVLARLERRGINLSQGDLTLEMVRAVVEAGNDVIYELLPDTDVIVKLDDDEILRAFEILADCELPSGPLERVQMITAALGQAVEETLDDHF